MNPKNPAFDQSRRKFLGSCCAAVSATGMLSTLAQLRVMGAVADPENNPVTPPRAGALALPRTQLLGISPKTNDGRGWALHSSLNSDVANTNTTGLKSLFDSGQMA